MPNNNSNPPRGATNKMLIDATHPEETRVVVLRNGRVEEFDYESAARKLLRGNIYLAKVTRVEPSLQAAFVDYGGNRHGFLAFNEIHPDYYQIPIADRRALIEAEAAAEAEEEAAADRAAEAAAARRARRQQRNEGRPAPRDHDDAEDNAIDVSPLLPPEPVEAGADAPHDHDEPAHADDHRHEDHRHDDRGHEDRGRDDHRHDDAPRSLPERTEADPYVSAEPYRSHDDERRDTETDGGYRSTDDAGVDLRRDEPGEQPRQDAGSDPDAGRDDVREDRGEVETVGAVHGSEASEVETVEAEEEDALEEVPVRPRRRLRSYKIQEVTKRRQVLLVQVVKEERGTKGAALTTYLSLAGRYTVLMPNTARGGGISRKINNPQDRKRLKAIAAELDVPEGMGLIIRTAGAARTKQEIKRDYEYLLRLWESVRELALNSNAPALVYEEGNLIKRSIRDLYGKEVDEIIVAGEAAYRDAKDFMRMLMPSHAKNVLYYQDPEPLFSRFQIERQLNAMFSPYVHLRSGGYLVINQTEALVAIDINSGKSTREFSIEETAYSTNMEAADEIARQLKLRDLAGLIVIDFIDMEEKRNNRAVERRIKDALRHDRARIQLGHISHFGLLEMSRQRMRTGVLEGSTSQCPHCQGTGIIRSTESVALAVLRGIEDALMAGQPTSLNVSTTAQVALYILNNKRIYVTEIENRYGITIQVLASDKMQGANFAIERTARREDAPRRPERTAVNMEWGFEDEAADAVVEPEDDEVADEAAPASVDDVESGNGGDVRRKRRRRRRGRRGDAEGGPRPSHGDDRGHGRAEPMGASEDENSPHEHRFIDDDQPHEDGDRGGSVEQGDDDVREEERGSPRHAEAAEGEGAGRRGRRRRRGRRGGRRGQERERGEFGGTDAVVGSEGLNGGRGHDGEAEHANGNYVRSDEQHQSEPAQPVEPPSAFEPPAWQPVEVAPAGGSGQGISAVMPSMSRSEPEPQPYESAEPMPAVVVQAPLAPTPAAAAQPTPGAAASPEPSPAAIARTVPVASEPVLARVVVGPDNAAVEETQEGSRPARRGWWQRK